MASAAQQVEGPRKRDLKEKIVAAAVIAFAIAMGYLMVTAGWFDGNKTTLQLGTQPRSAQIGAGLCRPSCRSTFHQCSVASKGFVYQQTRCQETLKSCINGCSSDSGSNPLSLY